MKLRDSLGVIWRIFCRDLLRLVKNPIALIVTIGVLFLPSVYAWSTIGADWEPYQKTEALKVGIANLDTGAENPLVGKINIGDDVVAKLKDDHHLGWQFVDEEQAMQGVYSGEYYASIVIPSDFSTDFLSVFSGDAKKPTINYYVNEKISAVAPELTDSGATTVETEINAQFVSTVTKTVVEMAKKAGTELSDTATSANGNLRNDLVALSSDINNVSNSIAGFDNSINSAESAIIDAKNIISGLQNRLPELENSLQTAQNGLNTLNSENQKNVNEAVMALAKVTTGLENLKTEVDAVGQQVNSATNLNPTIGDLSGLKDLLGRVSSSLETEIKNVENFQNSLTDTILPNTTGAFDHFSNAFGLLNGTVASLTPILNSTQSALDQLSATLELAKTAGASVETSLGAINNALNTAETSLSALGNSASVEQMAKFLHVSPEAMSEFMAAPVTLKTETLYPIKNYGTGVAPFFTNIALWVAGFILVAILHIGVDSEGFKKVTVTEAYFGRLMLFSFLGILQGIIVCSGDLIMGIQCASPVAYIFAGVVSVFVYVNIMYALVYTMRHIGRAIGVVILIMQIPGASGEYPVQMMPQFFRAIHPFLPFTYSIDAMREATGGMYGNQYWVDLLCLIPFLVLALALGLAVGRRAFNLNAMFDEELSKTDLFITEPAGQINRTFRLKALIQLLLDSKTYRKMVKERARKFSLRYPSLIHLGWILIILLPIAMLIINIFLPHDTETKSILLLLMVLGIIAVASYLICVEYLNYNLAHELGLSKMKQKEIHKTALKNFESDAFGKLIDKMKPGKEKDFGKLKSGKHDEYSQSESSKKRDKTIEEKSGGKQNA